MGPHWWWKTGRAIVDNKVVLVTGADGLVGRAFAKFAGHPKYDFVFVGRHSIRRDTKRYIKTDLTNEQHVSAMFGEYHPDIVIHTAARVGGIGGNMAHHGEFFRDNVLMNTHMIHYAYEYEVEKFFGFSSVCVFPDNLKVLQEDLMHEGPIYHENFAYGYAKRMMDIQIQAYTKQYGISNYCSIIPCNIFGANDYYNIEYGHVMPSLMHKLYVAKRDGTPLHVWGDGTSQREFISSDDIANHVFALMNLDTIPDRLILAGRQEYTIKEVVEKLCRFAKFDGEVVWETTKSNGQRRRPTDTSRAASLVHVTLEDFDKQLEAAYNWFERNYATCRK